MTRDTTVTAVFTGDARYAPKTVKSTAYAKVKVSTAVSKHYKTGKIGSTTYYYFHKNTDAISTTTMSYYTGRKQRLQLQVYYQGTLVRLRAPSTSRWAPTASRPSAWRRAGESGVRARVRSSYINGTSGDNVNSTTHGAWKYFIFTS